MDCQPTRRGRTKNKFTESVHINIVIDNQNNQLLFEVQALTFKKFQCSYVYQMS